MLPQWIIEKKRDGLPLSDDELAFFIGGYASGEIPDYQMSALAMAVFFRGMTRDETACLTRVMMASGDLVDTSSITAPKVDKHSTGGIGDKISLILAPLVASCGVSVPMISGRGLGITGGTLDKLESIPGYRVDLSDREFLHVLGACGCSIIGQTARLAPADRKLYALRDVTATVPSIPLIVASIMSKKLAEGIDGLVLDVKCGRGAFMHSQPDAQALASALIGVGASMGKRVTALITAMDQPLGRTVGNALEVIEAIETLQDKGPEDVVELTLRLGAEMLHVGGIPGDENAHIATLRHKLATGEALRVFEHMVALHGGSLATLANPSILATAPVRIPCPSPADGFIQAVDADRIGRACLLLGAGRTRTTDKVDHAVGMSGLARIGDAVSRNQPLAILHAGSAAQGAAALALASPAFEIGPRPAATPALILDRRVD